MNTRAERRNRAIRAADPLWSGALPPVGSAPVLTWDRATGAAALWRLSLAGDGDVSCVASALDAIADARALALRVLPVLARPDRLDTAPSDVRLRLVEGAASAAVDGASLGLAAALAWVSWLTDQPLDPSLTATGAITSDGEIGTVDGVVEKANMLPGGVAFWTPSDAPRGSPTRVRDLVRQLPGRLVGPVPPVTDAALHHLFTLILDTHAPVVRWPAWSAAAARWSGNDARLAWKRDWVRHIASRHAAAMLDGDPIAPVPDWAPARALQRPLRVTLRAEQVQGLNDLRVSDWRPAARSAARALPRRPIDDDTRDLRLCGSLGRLHAAWGDLRAATTFLSRAVRGWSKLDRLSDASHALCEWLRVAGPRRELLHLAEACRAATPSARRRSYLDTAVARAGMDAGRADRVAAPLHRADVPWGAVDAHVDAARLRQLGRASGWTDDRRDVIRELDGEIGALADLDVALARGEPWEATLERLPVAERQRIATFAPGPDGVARWWPYG